MAKEEMQVKEHIAHKTTVKIMEAILIEQNGYSKEEIKNGNLAEECFGSPLFESVYDIIYKTITKK